MDLAFRYHADSVMAVERMARYRELAPESFWNRYYDWIFALAFGDAAVRAGAMDELAASELLDQQRVTDRLTHPRFWPAQAALLALERSRVSEEEGLDELRELLLGNVFAQGRLDAALRYLDDPLAPQALTSCNYMYVELTLQIASHPFESELALESIEADSVGASVEPGELLARLSCSALYASYRGREEDYRLLRERIDVMASAAAAQDTSAANLLAGLMQVIDGFNEWLSGDSQAAYDILVEFTPRPDLTLPNDWWAQVLIDVDRPDEALPYLLAMRSSPVAHLYLGRAYEALGRDAEARDAYEYFLSNWAEADLDLLPLLDRARRALMRIAARLN